MPKKQELSEASEAAQAETGTAPRALRATAPAALTEPGLPPTCNGANQGNQAVSKEPSYKSVVQRIVEL